MKKIFIFIFLILIFSLASCNKNKNIETSSDTTNDTIISTEEITETKEEKDYNFYDEDKLNDGEIFKSVTSFALNDKTYNLKFGYNDSYFDKNMEYNQDIAMFSLGATISSGYTSELKEYYNNFGFDSYYAYGYDFNDIDSIAFLICKKDNIIALTIRGFSYGFEWANNFKLGPNSNHEGFSNAADIVYSKLEQYLNENKNSETKLLINGYSRAGAVANILAYKIQSNANPIISSNDLFVYTFEAPRGLLKSNAIEYKNVYNIYNSLDLVPTVVPIEFDFYRCGIDIDIYNPDIEKIFLGYDKEIDYKKPTNYMYIKDGKYNTLNDSDKIAPFIFETLINTNLKPNDNNVSINSREAYYNNYESAIVYFIKYLGTMTNSLSNHIIKDIIKKINSDDFIPFVIDLLAVEDKLYNFLNPYFIEHNLKYDEEELKINCNKIKNLYWVALPLLTDILNNRETVANLAKMHDPIPVYILLKYYNKNR